MSTPQNWERLKRWVVQRHDYLEAQYKQSNFSADAAELGAFRAVYQAMRDIEDQSSKKGGETAPQHPIQQKLREKRPAQKPA